MDGRIINGALSTEPDIQLYKYNGKELDRTHGLDWYDYGARMFDAADVVWRILFTHW